MAGYVENLDENAEFSQVRRAARELPRIKHIRRLVDEVARQHDAVSKANRTRPSLFGGIRIGAGEIDLHFRRPLLTFLALGLVSIERVRPQPSAEH